MNEERKTSLKRKRRSAKAVLCDELNERLLGRIYKDTSRYCAPEFCQVVGWSKNTERVNAKRRYVHVRVINTINVTEDEFKCHGGRTKVVMSDILTDIDKPIYSIDRLQNHHTCLFNYSLQDDSDDSDAEEIDKYERSTVRRQFKYDKETLHTLVDFCEFDSYTTNDVASLAKLSDTVFTHYHFDD